MTKLSVVMPTYNASGFLHEALNSVLNQTHSDFEFIIIDDGSTDNTFDIIQSFNDKRINVIRNKKRLGLPASLNLGVELSSGEYIARMDADDISILDRFESQIRSIKINGADICGSHSIVIDDQSRVIDTNISPIGHHAILLRMVNSVPFSHGSVMFSKDFFVSNRLRYNTSSMAEDYKLWMDFWDAGAKFVNCDEFLYKYRVHSNSISSSKLKKLKKESIKLRKNFYRKNFIDIHHSINVMLSEKKSEYNHIIDLFVPLYLAFPSKGSLLNIRALAAFSSWKDKIHGIYRIYKLYD
jgi:glycosyltransferase involved in cell wall biosynthesis